jgi:hypothetical protein
MTGAMRLFIATHAPSPLPEISQDFSVIGLGGFRPETALPVVTDDTGDSISAKNRHYSELTGHYWLWKNLAGPAIVGVCQYRRYFLFNPHSPRPKVRVVMTAPNLARLTGPQCRDFVQSALEVADVIVPRSQELGEPLSSQYVSCHRKEDWNLFLQAIGETCQDFRTHLSWFDRTTSAHLYNMMIAPKPFFDAYMTRLFAVTDWMERQGLFPVEPYQCRVPAFIAERFFSFYLHVTQARCFEVPVAVLDPKAF